MVTADRHRRRVLTALVVAWVVVLGAVVSLVVWRAQPDGGDVAPEPMQVVSSARHRFAGLDALVAASDLVVTGRVVSVEPGRVFGDVDRSGRAVRTAVRSQVVTLEVGRVLAGVGATGDSRASAVVLVEEEASLANGTPLRVDGARPSRRGDDGVWFLAAAGDPDFPGYVVVNSQGRYLATGDRLVGADRSDPLVRSLEALGTDGLTQALDRAAR